MQNDGRLTYTVKEAATKLGISKNLAYDLARRGELPGVIRLGKRLLISAAQLERLLTGNSEVNKKYGNGNDFDSGHCR